MTTILERDRTTRMQQNDCIFVYLTTLLTDSTLVQSLHQTFSLVHTEQDSQGQGYRLAARIAVEEIRAQTLNSSGDTSKATLREEALACMPRLLYQALILYAHEGASYVEIGCQEGISEGTAHTRVCRAKRWLWEALPSKLCEKPTNETEIFAFLVNYLRRLVASDEAAEWVASTTTELIRRQCSRVLYTPFEKTQRFSLTATNLVIDILHKQAYGQPQNAPYPLALRRDTMTALPPQLRRAILLYIQGADYASIAAREGINLSTATVRVSHARTWIRQHLVPPDELALAIAAIEWAEKREVWHQEMLSDEERPDVMLPDDTYQHNKGLYHDNLSSTLYAF